MAVKRVPQELSVLALYLAGSVYFTYPLAAGVDRLVTDLADPLLNSWALSWDVHQLGRDPLRLFDANVFHPETGTLAFSEHLLGLALLAAPVELFFREPVLTHNVTLLLLLTLSGYGTYRLTRFVTGSERAGFVAGALFAFLPYRLGQLSHLQLQATVAIPLVFLSAGRYCEAPRGKRARWLVALSLSLGWLTASCGYYGVFVWILLGVLLPYELLRTRSSGLRARAAGLLAALALTAATLLPLARPYFRLEREFGFSRPIERLVPASARVRSYARTRLALHHDLGLVDANAEQTLFPGFTLAALALLGLPFLDRRGALYVLVLGFSFWASLGPPGGLYSALHALVPGVSGLRVPARFSILVFFALAVLAGGAASALERHLGRAKNAVLLLAILPLVESRGTTIPLTEAPVDPPGAVRFLAEDVRDGALVHLPMPFDRERIFENAVYMLWSTEHFLPIANGYSGFAPPSFYELAEALASFPDDRSVSLLEERGIDFVVLHVDRYLRTRASELRAAVASDPRFEEIFRDDRSVVYRLAP